jgi:hypothetical protein
LFVKVVVGDLCVFDLEQNGEADGRRVLVCRVKGGLAVGFVVGVFVKG